MVERGKATSVTLKDCIHCPKASFNLISLGCITDARFELKFKESVRPRLTRDQLETLRKLHCLRIRAIVRSTASLSDARC